MIHVVALQARRIQRYLFHSPRLRHMVGGSHLVDTLCKDRVAQLLEGCGVREEALRVAAAGKAWVVLEDEGQARRLARLLPVVADVYAPGLEVDVVLGSGASQRAAYDAARNALEAVGGCPRLPCPELAPLVARAPHTGGPAVGTVRYGEGSERQDDVTWRQDRAIDAADARLRAVCDDALEWPRELEEITGEEHPLAVVHADGNGLGQVLERLNRSTAAAERPLDVQRDIALAIERAATAALRDAVEVLRTVGAERRLPGRPLVFGGDDLTIVLRGDVALPFVVRYLERFEAQTEAELGPVLERHGAGADVSPRLTACAGIAVVKRSYPFMRAYELADSLCDWAKRRSREALPTHQGLPRIPSSVAFYRVTASITGDYAEVLEHELAAADGVELAAGPYAVGSVDAGSLPTLARLETLSKALGELPRGASRHLLAELKRDREAARHLWLRTLNVAGPEKERRLREARHALDGTDVEFPPGTKDSPTRTALLDAYVHGLLVARRKR